MKWSVLNKIYSGIIGNSLFIISLTSIISAVPLLDISSIKMSFALIGAIIISASFVFNKIYIPSVVSLFTTDKDYFDYLYKLKEKNSIGYTHEFSVLEDDLEQTNKLSVFKSKEFNLKKFEGIQNYKTLMDESALHSLSIIKYDYINSLHKTTRYILSVSFFIGALLLYTPTAVRIIELLIKGLNKYV